ncbi:hypothetical protein RRF57_010623 [Xylaria bambusicola]|uniref:Uncharacterized protein n=1 Tax=Xylaria bambusicola TaxID=326684 RepID=A0AAN7ZCP7_9PEZI
MVSVHVLIIILVAAFVIIFLVVVPICVLVLIGGAPSLRAYFRPWLARPHAVMGRGVIIFCEDPAKHHVHLTVRHAALGDFHQDILLSRLEIRQRYKSRLGTMRDALPE